MDSVFYALQYPLNWIRFLEINKFLLQQQKIRHFQQIENWFWLTEKFKHVQTSQLKPLVHYLFNWNQLVAQHN